MLANGTAGQVLSSNGTKLAPSWISTTGLTIGTANNLSGGVTGSIPYQNSAGTTLMLAPGISGQVLSTNGAGAPSWVSAATGDMTLVGNQTVTGAKTFGVPGNVGKLIVAGTTSGTTTINANPIATNGIVTLPNTGVLATLDGNETLTQKTLTSPIMTAPTLGIVASGNISAVTGNAPALTA